MKKISLLIFSALFCYKPLFPVPLNATESHAPLPIKCAPELAGSLTAIQHIPEGRELITFIQKEGPIELAFISSHLSNQFQAFWDPDQRVICIHPSADQTEGSMIGSLLFELCNASTNSQIDRLDQMAMRGNIAKDQYVEAMEYLEYKNSLKAAKIAEKGVEMGLLPTDARLPTYDSFEEHFAVQKEYGHSAHFGRNYDSLSQSLRAD